MEAVVAFQPGDYITDGTRLLRVLDQPPEPGAELVVEDAMTGDAALENLDMKEWRKVDPSDA